MSFGKVTDLKIFRQKCEEVNCILLPFANEYQMTVVEELVKNLNVFVYKNEYYILFPKSQYDKILEKNFIKFMQPPITKKAFGVFNKVDGKKLRLNQYLYLTTQEASNLIFKYKTLWLNIFWDLTKGCLVLPITNNIEYANYNKAKKDNVFNFIKNCKIENLEDKYKNLSYKEIEEKLLQDYILYDISEIEYLNDTLINCTLGFTKNRIFILYQRNTQLKKKATKFSQAMFNILVTYPLTKNFRGESIHVRTIQIS